MGLSQSIGSLGKIATVSFVLVTVRIQILLSLI